MRAVRGIVAILGLILGFIAVADAAELYFIHPDHLNTPRLIANAAGQTVWSWNNDDPFGNNAPNEDPSSLGAFTYNLRLPGQYFDKETNTHYNYFRDYDPAIGRYVESDPIGLQGGVNTYAYVQSNPLSNTDPTGECPWCLAGAGLGAALNIATQVSQNGGNWGQIQWQQVGFSAASGLLGGGLGTATASLRFGWNVLANTAGSSGIGAGLAFINNQLFPAAQQTVCTAAINAGVFGGAGAFLGGAVNQGFAAYRAYQFGQLPLATRVLLGSNAITGPYFPPGTPNWAIGGTATGNLISNTVSNLNQ